MEAQRQLRQTSEAIKAIADDLDQACLLQSYDDVTTGDWGSPGGRPETCGYDRLIRPRRDGLIRPHVRHAGVMTV